jgi:sialate O-acetylesterase
MKPSKFLLISLFFSFISTFVVGQQKDFLVSLDGLWKFQIGDSLNWNNPEYDDNEWESINVPSAWEDQGFFGYDGYAWYRKEFTLTKDYKNKDISLLLGYIDDVDEVYINGQLIGFSGTFPPKFSTALDVLRKYPVPDKILNMPGKNVIAVRVYDHHMSGGIISGNNGIVAEHFTKPEIPLSGVWYFRAGDNMLWKEREHNIKNWHNMVVPGNWKNHGYKNYDGIAWYRTKVVIPDEFENSKFMFIIGKIDNCDEVYINGELIGSTGSIQKPGRKQQGADNASEDEKIFSADCQKPRIYAIPDNLLLLKKENIISIRVYNKNFKGGITEGPIGLIRLSTYTKLVKEKQLIFD